MLIGKSVLDLQQKLLPQHMIETAAIEQFDVDNIHVIMHVAEKHHIENCLFRLAQSLLVLDLESPSHCLRPFVQALNQDGCFQRRLCLPQSNLYGKPVFVFLLRPQSIHLLLRALLAHFGSPVMPSHAKDLGTILHKLRQQGRHVGCFAPSDTEDCSNTVRIPGRANNAARCNKHDS